MKRPWFKANSMMQYIERNQNKTFINLPSLPWNSEISGAIHLAQLGLTAGRQADEIQVNFKFLNSLYSKTFDFLLFLTKVRYMVSRIFAP